MQKVTAVKVDGAWYSCFGLVDHVLYLASRHHMAIMTALLQHGYDYDSLMNAHQSWGWLHSSNIAKSDGGPGQEDKVVEYYFSTDAGAVDDRLKWEATYAFSSLTGLVAKYREGGGWGQTNSEYAPKLEQKYGPGGYLSDSELPQVLAYDIQTKTKQVWLPEEVQQGLFEKDETDESEDDPYLTPATWPNLPPEKIPVKKDSPRSDGGKPLSQFNVGDLVIGSITAPGIALWKIISKAPNNDIQLEVIQPNSEHPETMGNKNWFTGSHIFYPARMYPLGKITRADRWYDTPPWVIKETWIEL